MTFLFGLIMGAAAGACVTVVALFLNDSTGRWD